MKLGICYMVFDGEELLPFAVSNIRSQVDFMSVTYQTTSYHGNKTADLRPFLETLGVDEIVHYEPDLTLKPKENELRLRNLGRELSERAGCTHHISADVDEFYVSEQLAYVKEHMDGYDYSVVHYVNYFKEPTYQVQPEQNVKVSLIHPVSNPYVFNPKFPFGVEQTRRFANGRFRLFGRDEFKMHHMSFVRKDVRKKLANSGNGRFYNEQFLEEFENYQLGGKVCLVPDFIERTTVRVDNFFGIYL